MQFAVEDLDRATFDARTRNRWTNEPLETFVCLRCGTLYLGVPYAHDLLLNGADPLERMTYNVPQGTSCPVCGNILQGKGQQTREPTPGEIASSSWGWILRR